MYYIVEVRSVRPVRSAAAAELCPTLIFRRCARPGARAHFSTIGTNDKAKQTVDDDKDIIHWIVVAL